MLRLPGQVSENDQFPVTVRSDEELSVSATFHASDEANTEAFELRCYEGTAFPSFVCANPAAVEDRLWRDPIAAGACGAPERQMKALWAVETQRRLPGSANFGLRFQRAGSELSQEPLQIRVGVGGMRRLAIIPANISETAVEFPLDAEEPGHRWPLVFHSAGAIEWSASVSRGFESSFLPAFSLVDV
jgi:hypothetical protein